MLSVRPLIRLPQKCCAGSPLVGAVHITNLCYSLQMHVWDTTPGWQKGVDCMFGTWLVVAVVGEGVTQRKAGLCVLTSTH